MLAQTDWALSLCTSMDPAFQRLAQALLPHAQYVRMCRICQNFEPVCISLPGQPFQLVLRGSSGHDYLLQSDDRGLTCSCPDFLGGLPQGALYCKHICWLLVHGTADLSVFQGDSEAKDAAVHRAWDSLIAIMSECNHPYEADPERCGEDECPICYDPLGVPADCIRCGLCRRHFHTRCIFEWMQQSKSCPLCRSEGWVDLSWGLNLTDRGPAVRIL